MGSYLAHGPEIYPKAHENPRAFSCIFGPILLESSIQCPWRVGLHHIDETVSIDSKIISIVSWPDYTFEEEKVNKDYKIINEFTRNEYTDLYPVYDKYNHYGKIFDYLGYNLMFKTELKIVNMKYNSTQDLITKNVIFAKDIIIKH